MAVRRFPANTGPYATEDDALHAVVDRLVRALDLKAIYLFGSRARGTHRPDSDYDLYVVTKQSDGDAGWDHDRVYAPLLGLGIGCDVAPCPKRDFDSAKDDPTTISFAAAQGRLLYARSYAGLRRLA
jgi:hypothetical protein